MSAVTIDLNAIVANDVVTITDVVGNRAQGFVMINAHGALLVACFGTSVLFARPTRTGNVVLQHGVRLLDHQPQLFQPAP